MTMHSTDWGGRADLDQPIERRILDALIWIVHTRGLKPKVIYLSEADMKQFCAVRKTWRERNYVDGIPVRAGNRSVFYTACWRHRRI